MAPSEDQRERGRTPGQGTGATDSLPLLALYPNLRQTGWALFGVGTREGPSAPFLAASGIVGPGLQRKTEPRHRIAFQLHSLALNAEQWRPSRLVCSWPGGMDWGAAGMRELEEHLRQWAASRGLGVIDYPAPQVRASLAEKPNASKDALAYAVMSRLGLIGEFRSAPEWEAIAVGYHHLQWLGKRVADNGPAG